MYRGEARDGQAWGAHSRSLKGAALVAGRQVGRQGAAGLGLGCKGGHVPWGLVEPALGAISPALSAGVGSLGSGRSQHPSLPRYPPHP